MPAHSTLRLCSGQAFFARCRTCAGTSFTQPLWQRQGLLLSFIPNQLPSRQVQFLSYALVRLFDYVQSHIFRMDKRKNKPARVLVFCSHFILFSTPSYSTAPLCIISYFRAYFGSIHGLLSPKFFNFLSQPTQSHKSPNSSQLKLLYKLLKP